MTQDNEAAQLHLRLGTSYMNSGNYPQALNELLIAEKLDSSDAVIQNNLGLAYYFRGRPDLAENHLKKALSLKADYTDAKNNLGRVLIDLDKSKEAIDILQQATADLTYPYPEKPLLNLGMAFFAVGNYSAATVSLQKSIQYQRDNCLAQNFLGRIFYEQKIYEKAAAQLDKAAGFCMKSQYDEPNYYGALSYYQVGQKSKAEARLEEIINLYPNGKYSAKAKSMLEIIRK